MKKAIIEKYLMSVGALFLAFFVLTSSAQALRTTQSIIASEISTTRVSGYEYTLPLTTTNVDALWMVSSTTSKWAVLAQPQTIDYWYPKFLVSHWQENDFRLSSAVGKTLPLTTLTLDTCKQWYMNSYTSEQSLVQQCLQTDYYRDTVREGASCGTADATDSLAIADVWLLCGQSKAITYEVCVNRQQNGIEKNHYQYVDTILSVNFDTNTTSSASFQPNSGVRICEPAFTDIPNQQVTTP